MASKSIQTVVLGLGLGTGLYFASVGLQIGQAAREEQRLRKQALSEEKAARSSEEQQHVEEATVQRLEQQLQLQQQEVAALEDELSAARQRVVELEDMREARIKTAAETGAAIEAAGSKLARLAQEMRRHRESAAAAQAALGAAHIRVVEKRQLYNPLNHPMVKDLLKS